MNGKNNFLLDTNIVLGFLNGNPAINKFFQDNTEESQLKCSQVTRMELLGFPNITTDEEKKLKSFLSFVKILPITDEICNQTIMLRQQKKIKLPDALIVSTAICFNLTLITCDKDLLGKINSVKSINPVLSYE